MLKNNLWACIVVGVLLSGGAAAQEYPAKTITFYVPFAAGSATDTLARSLGQGITAETKHAIVVDNRPGANGLISAQAFIRTPADGYTVLIATNTTHAANEHLYKKIPYDPVRDFTPVTALARGGQVMIVNPRVPVKTVKEFIALAKSQPGKIDYSSGGNGSPQHVAMEAFKAATGIYVTHIPYRGATQAALDVIPNQVQAHFGAVSIVLPYIKSGRMRALAVPSANRSPLLPEVPTMAEAGAIDQEAETLNGLLAPAGTPRDIVDRLYGEIAKIMTMPHVAERLDTMGFAPIFTTPEQFSARIDAEISKWEKVIREAKIRID